MKIQNMQIYNEMNTRLLMPKSSSQIIHNEVINVNMKKILYFI